MTSIFDYVKNMFLENRRELLRKLKQSHNVYALHYCIMQHSRQFKLYRVSFTLGVARLYEGTLNYAFVLIL